MTEVSSVALVEYREGLRAYYSHATQLVFPNFCQSGATDRIMLVKRLITTPYHLLIFSHAGLQNPVEEKTAWYGL